MYFCYILLRQLLLLQIFFQLAFLHIICKMHECYFNCKKVTPKFTTNIPDLTAHDTVFIEQMLSDPPPILTSAANAEIARITGAVTPTPARSCFPTPGIYPINILSTKYQFTVIGNIFKCIRHYIRLSVCTCCKIHIPLFNNLITDSFNIEYTS